MKILKNDLKMKDSGPGTFIFKFSVKFRLEWYQFRRLKPKPCQITAKTVFQISHQRWWGVGAQSYIAGTSAFRAKRGNRGVRCATCLLVVVLFLPPLGPLTVLSSSFFWTTHLVLGTRRRRRFKPPPRCFGHSSVVVVVERHVPALDNAPAMM